MTMGKIRQCRAQASRSILSFPRVPQWKYSLHVLYVLTSQSTQDFKYHPKCNEK